MSNVITSKDTAIGKLSIVLLNDTTAVVSSGDRVGSGITDDKSEHISAGVTIRGKALTFVLTCKLIDGEWKTDQFGRSGYASFKKVDAPWDKNDATANQREAIVTTVLATLNDNDFTDDLRVAQDEVNKEAIAERQATIAKLSGIIESIEAEVRALKQGGDKRQYTLKFRNGGEQTGQCIVDRNGKPLRPPVEVNSYDVRTARYWVESGTLTVV